MLIVHGDRVRRVRRLLQKVVNLRTTARTQKRTHSAWGEGALTRRTKRSSKVHGWPSFAKLLTGSRQTVISYLLWIDRCHRHSTY